MIGRLSVNAEELIDFCNRYGFSFRPAENSPEPMVSLTGIEPINSAAACDISFCRFEDERADQWISSSNAGCVIVPLTYKNSSVLRAETVYVFAEH